MSESVPLPEPNFSPLLSLLLDYPELGGAVRDATPMGLDLKCAVGFYRNIVEIQSPDLMDVPEIRLVAYVSGDALNANTNSARANDLLPWPHDWSVDS